MEPKELKENVELIQESGLSRVYGHIMEHDCAIISAFRGDPADKANCVEESKQLNMQNHRMLKAALLRKKYGVTDVDGSYIEDFETLSAKEVKEKSLFVVNLNDDDDFFKTIVGFGKKLCQDSVLFIPRGGKGAFLYGTNEADFPGLGNKMDVGNLSMGKESEFMTKVKKKPFVFKEELDTWDKLQMNSKWIATKLSEQMNDDKD